MFTQMRFNLKHTGAILFALVFLVGGFFISNVAMAEGAPIITNTTFDQVNKTITYFFSEPIQLVDQANPTSTTTDFTGKVKIYTSTSYANRNTGDSEPANFGGTVTASYISDSNTNKLVINYTTDLPVDQYLADTWGYTVTDLDGNQLDESNHNALFTVESNSVAPTIASSNFNQINKTITYTFDEPIQLVNQATGEKTTDFTGKVKIYTAASYASRTAGQPEPESFGGSITANYSNNDLVITYANDLSADTYLADTWGYTVTDLAGNKLNENNQKALFTVTAPIQISSISQLRDAIEHQADGQTWIISAGDYGLDRFNDITVEGQTGWYFPITANNLIIEGQGNPVIYGNEFSLNGNWSTQNLLSVFGNNVTIKGLTLMPKAEGNKTIEVLGNDINIEDVVIKPNTIIDSSVYDGISNSADKAFSKEWGGSIYFSHAGNHIVKNVTINNGGVSFRYSPLGTHIIFDNVNIINKTAIDDINSYRYSSGFNNQETSNTGLPKVTYNVDASTNNFASALIGAKDGDIIEFASDIATNSQLEINKAITIDGTGHTLTTTATGGSVINISTNNVTLKNLIEDGGGTAGNNRGINIYQATGVTLDTVTASNNKKYGIIVNGSTVTVNKITTANNGWGGINVDLGVGVISPSNLTVNGVSSHTESTAIFIDDITKAVTVTDTNHQYSHKDTGNARVFSLLATGQTIPDENGTATVTNTNKDVVVTSSAQPLTIDIGSVTNATIDVGSLVTVVGETKTGTIPQTTITSNIADVEIPSTTITSSDKNWDGTINLPKIITTTVQPVADSGNTATVVASIEVGFGDTHLTFNDPVKLTFAGQAGSSIGWSQNGAFHSITNTCNSSTNPTLDADSDCKINVGNDLVVWTKHFTTFTTYTQTTNPVSHGSGGYVRAIPATPAVPGINKAIPATPAIGQVLGAEKYNFTKVMKNNSKGNEVIELQKFLTSLGYTLSADGKFGPKTKAAVIKFQKANGLKGDGIIGPLTRAVLNK